MIQVSFMPSPHDGPPPIEIPPPETFEGVELFPAVAIEASRAEVGGFGRLVERDDEWGKCLAAHFEVHGTLVVFYQSAVDPKEQWTVLVDMNKCVVSKQVPTLLGISAVRFLTANEKKPFWINGEADQVYRTRRHSWVRERNQEGRRPPYTEASPEPSFIDLAAEDAVRYWTKRLRVTERQLRDAVEAKGPNADRVRRYLKK